MADEVAEALLLACARGVKCKILLDSIGSDTFLKGSMVKRMQDGGIEIVESLPANEEAS